MSKPASKSRSTIGVNRVIVRPKPLSQTRCLLRFGHLTFQASWGRSGRSIFKREGDGATPIAKMQILYGVYKHRINHRRPCRIDMKAIQKTMGWCDESDHPQYNRLVKLPFQKSCELMLRSDRLYDFVFVIDWNIKSRKRQQGSAIFFHVAKPGYPPTEGCIAMSRSDMMQILPYLGSKAVLEVK